MLAELDLWLGEILVVNLFSFKIRREEILTIAPP